MELPDRAEDRSKITQGCRLLTLGPGGASDFLRKSAIIRRLRRHLLPKDEGLGTSSCSTSDTKPNPVTLTIYSSPPKAAIPQPSGQRPVKPKHPRGESPVNLKNLFPSPKNLLNPGRAAAPFPHHKKSPPDNRWAFSYCLNLSMILSRKELFPLYWEQSSPISLAKWRRAFFWSSFSRLGTVTWTST